MELVGTKFSVADLSPYLTTAALIKIEIDPVTGCWIWNGCRHAKRGYAKMCYNKKVWPGHVLTYTLLIAPIPKPLVGDHQCHDPELCYGGDDCPHRPCVNPEHIKPSTQKENTLRSSRVLRDRALTHCKHKHEFTVENTYWRSNGTRACKKCRTLRERTSYQKKALASWDQV